VSLVPLTLASFGFLSNGIKPLTVATKGYINLGLAADLLEAVETLSMPFADTAALGVMSDQPLVASGLMAGTVVMEDILAQLVDALGSIAALDVPTIGAMAGILPLTDIAGDTDIEAESVMSAVDPAAIGSMASLLPLATITNDEDVVVSGTMSDTAVAVIGDFR